MRVLIVSHTYIAPINRAKLDALAQYTTLDAIIPKHWPDALFDLESQFPQTAGYAIHPLPIRFGGHILRYLYPIKHLNSIIQHSQPDLVYVEEEPPSLVLAQFAFLKQRHRYKLVCFTWENIARRAGLPGILRYNLKRCDGIIAGNIEAEAIQRRRFHKPICATPQLGVDPDRFRPARAHELRQALDLSQFSVGYIGRLTEEKGLRTLLDAIGDLPYTQLLLVGRGPLRREIESIIQQRAMHHRVRLLDSAPHEQIADYLNAVDVLVLPSRTTPAWKEQFGHILIEAMACGAPVVGSNSGAIPEVIGDAGLIFTEGDSQSLRDALQRLASDDTLREQFARAGRQRVLTHYTHQSIASANVQFFKRVLAA